MNYRPQIIVQDKGIPTYSVTLPALTVRQPYAHLIIEGVKKWEVRNWNRQAHKLIPSGLAGNYLAIHASRKRSLEIDREIKEHNLLAFQLRYGYIIGIVKVPTVRVLTAKDEKAAMCSADGSLGIGCSEPVRLKGDIYWRGRQQIFPVQIPLSHIPNWWLAMSSLMNGNIDGYA